MLGVLSVVALLGAAAAHGEHERGCATPEIDYETGLKLTAVARRTRERLCSRVPSLRVCRQARDGERQEYVIDVAFHIIYDPATGRGNLSEAIVNDQLRVLNDGYAGNFGPDSFDTGLRFNMVLLNYVGNAAWFNNLQAAEREMRNALAYEPLTTLQIYSGDFRAGLLGYCYFPSSYPEDSPLHGCSNLYSSFPDAGPPPYNLGQTVTHEVGHGVGLFHTFQGAGCMNGDLVDDTPPQRASTSGCPSPAPNSCDGSPPDMIENFMDYSFDACMDRFTAGQADRAVEQLLAFRPSLILSKEELAEARRYAPDSWDEAVTMQKIMANRA